MGPVIHMSNSSSEGNRYTLASHEFKLAQKKSSYWSGVQEQDCLQVCLQLDIDKSIGFSGNLFFFLRDLNPFWDETFQITVDDISAPLDLKVSIILPLFSLWDFIRYQILSLSYSEECKLRNYLKLALDLFVEFASQKRNCGSKESKMFEKRKEPESKSPGF